MPYADAEKRREASRRSAARRRLKFPEKCRARLVKDLSEEELQRRRAQKRRAQAKWAARHPEKKRALGAKWAAENPERVKAIAAASRAKNKVKKRARAAAYKAANLEKVRQQKRAAAKRYADAHPERRVAAELKRDNGIADPPEELVELIVTSRRLKRLLKEKQDEQ